MAKRRMECCQYCSLKVVCILSVISMQVASLVTCLPAGDLDRERADNIGAADGSFPNRAQDGAPLMPGHRSLLSADGVLTGRGENEEKTKSEDVSVIADPHRQANRNNVYLKRPARSPENSGTKKDLELSVNLNKTGSGSAPNQKEGILLKEEISLTAAKGKADTSGAEAGDSADGSEEDSTPAEPPPMSTTEGPTYTFGGRQEKEASEPSIFDPSGKKLPNSGDKKLSSKGKDCAGVDCTAEEQTTETQTSTEETSSVSITMNKLETHETTVTEGPTTTSVSRVPKHEHETTCTEHTSTEKTTGQPNVGEQTTVTGTSTEETTAVTTASVQKLDAETHESSSVTITEASTETTSPPTTEMPKHEHETTCTEHTPTEKTTAEPTEEQSSTTQSTLTYDTEEPERKEPAIKQQEAASSLGPKSSSKAPASVEKKTHSPPSASTAAAEPRVDPQPVFIRRAMSAGEIIGITVSTAAMLFFASASALLLYRHRRNKRIEDSIHLMPSRRGPNLRFYYDSTI